MEVLFAVVILLASLLAIALVGWLSHVLYLKGRCPKILEERPKLRCPKCCRRQVKMGDV
jgi:hypothetical protein